MIRMFERYNEKARRTIFFARYEASTFGSPYIEAEFLLLGLLREDRTLSSRLFTSYATVEAIRGEIERHHPPAKSIPTSVDLPLSNEGKRVLAYAAEEADRLGHPFIGTEHLLLGILREQNSFAFELLRHHALNLEDLRKDIAEKGPPQGPGVQGQRLPASTLGFFQLVLKVADLKASIDLYTKLGFTSVLERSSHSAVLTNGSCNLRLDQNLAAADHLLSFLSPDITPIVSRLQWAGLELDRLPLDAADGGATASLRDPDGNVITLHNPSRPTRSDPPS